MILKKLFFQIFISKKGTVYISLKTIIQVLNILTKSLSLDRGNIESQVFINYNKSKIVEP